MAADGDDDTKGQPDLDPRTPFGPIKFTRSRETLRWAIARKNYERFQAIKPGHMEFCYRALRNNDYYVGGGLQWADADRVEMEEVRSALCVEVNEIKRAIDDILGYQIQNRVDISYQPRGGLASEEIASTLSKVARQITDNVKLPWLESQLFEDGLIMSRGFYDYRVCFDDSLKGEFALDVLDPCDVIPDPDATWYDPDRWKDVTISRLLTLDEIECWYGTAARKAVERAIRTLPGYSDDQNSGPGSDPIEGERSTFQNDGLSWLTNFTDHIVKEPGNAIRVRVIDRQRRVLVPCLCVVSKTGEINIAENMSPDKRREARKAGSTFLQHPMYRVRWTVSTINELLHDDWSPLRHYSVIPYFPFFRRGITRGAVDNAIGPQDMLNKNLTSVTSILTSVANSGWMFEQGSIVNMSREEFLKHGASSGLNLEILKGAQYPKKIEPNEIPAGMTELIKLGIEKVQSSIGASQELKGAARNARSGDQVESQQYGAQISNVKPLDMLAFNRYMLGMRILEFIQDFEDEPRILRIIGTDPKTGEKTTETIHINHKQANGVILNDLSVGEYEAVITELPHAATFQHSQYNQALDMREKGIPIPPEFVIRYSTLNDKLALLEAMKAAPPGSQLDAAKAALMEAQTLLTQMKAKIAENDAASKAAKADAETANKRMDTVVKGVTALFSAIRTAQVIELSPEASAIADEIAKSAGFQDQNAAPIFPAPAPGATTPEKGPLVPVSAATAVPSNTDPLTPDHAATGLAKGIEGGGMDLGKPPGS